MDVFAVATAAEVEEDMEEKRSSTCGFFLVFFPEEDTPVAAVFPADENRSSSDSSSSNRPPNFSFGFDGVVFLFLSRGVSVADLLLSPESVTWLVMGGVLLVVGVVVGGPKIRPSSGGGLGELNRTSDLDFAAAGREFFFAGTEL